MKILALEPYYGGSHRAFLDGWRRRSRHDWTLLTLPASKWKWRMRHAALTFADQIRDLLIAYENDTPKLPSLSQGGVAEGRGGFPARPENISADDRPEYLPSQGRCPQGGGVDRDSLNHTPWDILFCSDMLNLAEFLGLAPEPVRRLPRVVYFHENQLTYPVRVESERDYQYALTNLTTALAADAVWFNSAFHRDEFLAAARRFLKRMPDFQPLQAVDRIEHKTEIHPPGIDPDGWRDLTLAATKCPGEDIKPEYLPSQGRWPKAGGADRDSLSKCPPILLWAARWEHDKNPEDFFAVAEKLAARGLPFRLNVIGEQFRDRPAVFDWAQKALAPRIRRWGYQPTRQDYLAALCESDIVVSTAVHEFFGIGVLEAIAAGCRPLLPNRLAYPQLLTAAGCQPPEKYLYNGTPAALCDQLETLIKECIEARRANTPFFTPDPIIQTHFWPQYAGTLDVALENTRPRT